MHEKRIFSLCDSLEYPFFFIDDEIALEIRSYISEEDWVKSKRLQLIYYGCRRRIMKLWNIIMTQWCYLLQMSIFEICINI